MKISLKKLREIVNEHAYHLKEMAGYSGSNNDGGCEKVLNQLKEFEYSIIVEKDLRPSEYSVLNDLEVDEPIYRRV